MTVAGRGASGGSCTTSCRECKCPLHRVLARIFTATSSRMHSGVNRRQIASERRLAGRTLNPRQPGWRCRSPPPRAHSSCGQGCWTRSPQSSVVAARRTRRLRSTTHRWRKGISRADPQMWSNCRPTPTAAAGVGPETAVTANRASTGRQVEKRMDCAAGSLDAVVSIKREDIRWVWSPTTNCAAPP